MSEGTTSKKTANWVENGKLCGDLVMYIGSAAIASTAIRKVRENNNGLMGACAIGTGAMLSVGLGQIASNILNKVIDKSVAFFSNSKTKTNKQVPEETDEESDEDDTE